MAIHTSLRRNAKISLIQAIVSAAIIFFLYKYLLNALGAETIGLWSIILATTSFARLTELGFAGSVARYVASYLAENEEQKAADAVETAALTVAGLASLVVFFGYSFFEYVLEFSIPTESLGKANSILPYALASFWIGCVAGVFQAGIDGCQKMAARNIILLLGNIFFAICAILLIPRYGIRGLAASQVIQAVLMLVANWMYLRQNLNFLHPVPLIWSKKSFKEMFTYATSSQINAVAILLFEPVTKTLMSRYAGLESAAFFEFASQLVNRVRGLIVAANQALVPAVAALQKLEPDKVRDLYIKSAQITTFIAIPSFCGLLVAMPIISLAWFGNLQQDFLTFGLFAILSWGINIISSPAYFINQGLAFLTPNTVAHISIAILNVVLGAFLGSQLGAIGVAAGYAISLAIGSIGIIAYTQINQAVRFSLILTTGTSRLFMFCILFTSLATSIEHYSSALSSIYANIVTLVIYCIFVARMMVPHPHMKFIFKR